MDSKIMIIAIVAVVAVAGVGGAIYFMGGNTSSSDDTVNMDDYASYKALVFGNADGDTDIDTDDVTVINDIISGTKDFKDYLLADANRDGKVTAEDADFVQTIIDGTATKVKIIDGQARVIETPYPLQKIFFCGHVNGRVALNVLDLQNVMVAFATNDTVYGKELDKQVFDLVDAGTIKQVSSSASDADFTNLSNLDFDVAVIEDSGLNDFRTPESQSKLRSLGVTPLLFNFDNLNDSVRSIATLGVLVKNTASATSYIDLQNSVIDTINTSLASVPENERKTVLSVVMSNSVSGTSSDYIQACIAAGGKPVADWTDSTKKFDPTKGDTWLYESRYNADIMIHFKSQDFNVTESKNRDTAIGYAEYFSETYTFKNEGYYLLNGVIPLPARIAYMAKIMYPTLMPDDWGTTIFQQFVDDYTGQTISMSGYVLSWNVADLLEYTKPTTIDLANTFLAENALPMGYSASLDVAMTTNGKVYNPTITNSDPSIATVSFVGNDDHTGGKLVVKASNTTGSTTITVSAGDATKTFTVNVSDIAATAIVLSQDNISLGLQANASLTYEMTPANASVNNFTFVSSDATTVSIGDGFVTGLKTGNATITVSVGSVSDDCTVTVADTEVTGITWTDGRTNDNDYKVCRGSSATSTYNYDIGFTLAPVNASVDDLSVVCSNTSIIKVESTTVMDGKIIVNFTRIDATTKALVTITVSVGDQSVVANLRCNGWSP